MAIEPTQNSLTTAPYAPPRTTGGVEEGALQAECWCLATGPPTCGWMALNTWKSNRVYPAKAWACDFPPPRPSLTTSFGHPKHLRRRIPNLHPQQPSHHPLAMVDHANTAHEFIHHARINNPLR